MGKEVYRRSAELLEADVSDELVALDPAKGTCFGFNSVAKDVWHKLEHPCTFEELRDALVAEYDVQQEQCSTELRELLDQLRGMGLVERETVAGNQQP